MKEVVYSGYTRIFKLILAFFFWGLVFIAIVLIWGFTTEVLLAAACGVSVLGFLFQFWQRLKNQSLLGDVLLDTKIRFFRSGTGAGWGALFAIVATAFSFLVIYYLTAYHLLPLPFGILLTLNMGLTFLLVLFVGSTKLKICDNGIFHYQTLIQWKDIEIYYWKDEWLCIAIKKERQNKLMAAMVNIKFPQELKESVDRILLGKL